MSNPIIQRELMGQLRTGRGLAVQLCLVIVLGLLVVLRWPVEGHVEQGGRQAQQVLQLFGYGMMVALMLLVPAWPATAIVREKTHGTLALLLVSPMGRWSIFFGKLIGAIGFIMLLLVLSLPAATACYAIGGGGLVKPYGILICMSLQYATLGLLASSLANTTESALRLTYGTVLVLAVVTLGPDQFLRGLAGPAFSAPIAWIRSVSPVPAMMEALGHGGVGEKDVSDAGGEPMRYMGLAIASSIIFSVLTAIRLNMRMLDVSRARGRITDERSLTVRIFRRVMFLWAFDPKRRSSPIGPYTNPVTVKELRCRRFGRRHWMMRLSAMCLIVSMGLAIVSARSSQQLSIGELARIVVLIQFAMILLLAPPLGAALISSERESGGLAMLVTTPLSAGSIICGKLLSAASTLFFVLVATAPAYVVMAWLDYHDSLRISGCVISLVLSAFLALLVSAAIGSLFRSTAAATATAYGLLIALCGGTMLVWHGRDAPFAHDTVQSALMFNPLAAMLDLVNAPGFTDYGLVPANWYITAVGCVLAAIVLMVQTWRLTQPR